MSKNGNNNYSHFFIQSIKYVSNFLQTIFDDKKKDFYFQFIKILKKIKNESFLRGLINQKKFHTLNKTKDFDKESDNNSQDVILYKANENYNVDNSNLESKSNDAKDLYKHDNEHNENSIFNKSNKDKTDSNENVDNRINKSMDVLGIKSSTPNKFCLLEEENLNNDIKSSKKNKSSNHLEYNELKDNNSFSVLDTSGQKIEGNKKYKKIDEEKLKQILENLDDYKNWRIIGKHFKIWNKIKNEVDESSCTERKEDSEIHIDYEKNVTISEACIGLSDVILDFKLYLIKFCLKNKEEKN